jgi:hypothetical protein
MGNSNPAKFEKEEPRINCKNDGLTHSNCKNDGLTVGMFYHWPDLERHIYSKIWKENVKYAYAHDKYNGVRMLLLKDANSYKLYYCENSEECSVIPTESFNSVGITELNDSSEEHNNPLNDSSEEDNNPLNYSKKYTIKQNIVSSLRIFLRSLGENDTIRTHKSVYTADIPDPFIKKELMKYFS